MDLHCLLFDFTDEDSGRGSFDAMASILPPRLPALLAEVEAVLQWAGSEFGPGQRITLTLTLRGSRAFCDAFREAFAIADRIS